jgi:O-antigen/teichoic acid export membrane protein
MKFKYISLTGLTSALLSGLAGVFMAYNGMGVWSLVIQNLLAAIIILVMNFYFTNWIPLMTIDKIKLKPLWEYGSRMFSSALLNSFVSRLDVFIIGKLFQANTVGFYTRAQSFDGVARQLTTGSLSSVLFPAVSKLQHDKKALMRLYKRYLHLISFIGMSLSGLLFLVTPDLFRLLFTEKWDSAAIYFQVMCISGFAWPISAIMVNMLAGTGNSKAYLQIEFFKSILLLPACAFLFFKGVLWFLWVMVFVRFSTVCFNAWFISRELNITVRKQLSIITLYLLSNIFVVFITQRMIDYSGISSYGLRLLFFMLFYLLFFSGMQMLFRTGAYKELSFFYHRLKNKI